MLLKIKYISLFILAFCCALQKGKSQSLTINELSANNISYLDDEGSAEDWIEIYNAGSTSVILSNFYLSDNIDSTTLWKLPNDTLLPNQFYIVFASGKNRIDSTAHTNFSLSKNGETVFLFDTLNNIVDSISYASLPLNVSWGRATDGTGSFVFFNLPTPNLSNNFSVGFNCQLDTPSVSLVSGFYTDSVQLNISHPDVGVQFYYTTNGIAPTTSDNLVTGMVTLYPDTSQNYYSLIPTNPSFNYPIGKYTATRANNRGWLPPYGDVKNINVLNIKAFKSGCLSSQTVVKTYFIGNGNTPTYPVPVVSINTDSSGFFSDASGIYVFGDAAEGNYSQIGMPWERPSFVEYFDVNQQIVFSEAIGLRINGHGSRHSTIKNLRVHARSQYGSKNIKANLFSASSINEFKHLLIRSGGHRPDCIPRDELAKDMVDGLLFDAPMYQYVLGFVNGEYWGIHALKEKLDEEYLSRKYTMADNDIVLLDYNGDVDFGVDSDSIHYKNMVNFAVNNDLNIANNYNYLNTQMDIDNYIDYMVSEIFIGNADWTYSNTKFWRKRIPYNAAANANHDGRWRWLFYDLDGGFGGSCGEAYYTFNGLKQALSTDSLFVKYTELFIALSNSQQFREKFILRASDLNNSKFKASVTNTKLNAIATTLTPLMLDHVNRWRYPSTSVTLANRQNEVPSLNQWNNIVTKLDTFLQKRTKYMFKHMDNEWLLADTFQLTMDVNDATKGYVQLNSIVINEFLDGVNSPVYPWSGTYFSQIEIPVLAIPKPGYLFVEWLGTGITNADTAFVIFGDTTFTAVFDIDPNYTAPFNVVINEVQSQNTTTVADGNGEFDDWIELYNPNNTAVTLNDYYLTDDPNQLTKFKIQSTQNVTIPANGWMLFWADNTLGQGVNHTNFKLSGNGEFVALVNSDGINVIDSISFPTLIDDESYGRNGDGAPSWVVFNAPTPNNSNVVVSIQENKALEYAIYPNPIKSNTIYISRNVNAKIYNYAGAFLFEIKNSNHFSVQNLTKGIYLIVFEDGTVEKIIKL